MKNLLATILTLIFYLPVNLYLMLFGRDMYPCSFDQVKDTWLGMLDRGAEPPDEDGGEAEATLAIGWQVLYKEHQEGKLTDEELASKVTQLIKGGKE